VSRRWSGSTCRLRGGGPVWGRVAAGAGVKAGRRPPRAELDAKVREIFDDSGGNPGTYGSPRVHAERRDQGWRVTEKTVAASMSRQHWSLARRSGSGA
jgi:hypothetical protein